jgi:hypothetical protein
MYSKMGRDLFLQQVACFMISFFFGELPHQNLAIAIKQNQKVLENFGQAQNPYQLQP